MTILFGKDAKFFEQRMREVDAGLHIASHVVMFIPSQKIGSGMTPNSTLCGPAK